jgi:hypothetical protein
MKRLLVVIPIVLAFVILSHYLLGLSAWGVRNWRHELAEAKLAQWRFMVRLHLPPDFGANLVF